jgi:hypothetical protein
VNNFFPEYKTNTLLGDFMFNLFISWCSARLILCPSTWNHELTFNILFSFLPNWLEQKLIIMSGLEWSLYHRRRITLSNMKFLNVEFRLFIKSYNSFWIFSGFGKQNTVFCVHMIGYLYGRDPMVFSHCIYLLKLNLFTRSPCILVNHGFCQVSLCIDAAFELMCFYSRLQIPIFTLQFAWIIYVMVW